MRRSRATRAVLAVSASLGINGFVVLSLAELARPEPVEDTHAPHASAPSIVPPPPPPRPAETTSAPTPSPSPAPELPVSADLELPALAPPTLPGSADGSGLALGQLGLPSLDSLRRSIPSEETEGPYQPPSQLSDASELARFYPATARRRALGGRTVLEVRVNALGRVESARILSSEPAGIFEDAALRAARSFRFEPARRGSRPVPSSTRLELRWEPQSLGDLP